MEKTGILISLILGGASVLVAIITGILAPIVKEHIIRNGKNAHIASTCLVFMLEVEKKLREELAEATKGNADGIKNRVRDEIQKQGFSCCTEYLEPKRAKRLMDKYQKYEKYFSE